MTSSAHRIPPQCDIPVALQPPSRTWLRPLRPLNRSAWTDVVLHVTSDAVVTFRPTSLPVSTKAPSHKLLPGGVRLATHSEQIAHLRDNIIVLTTVESYSHTSSSFAATAEKKTIHHVCQARSRTDALRLVSYAVTASFSFVGGPPSPRSLEAVLLHAWGPHRFLARTAVSSVTAALGNPLTQRELEPLFTSLLHRPALPSHIPFADFSTVFTTIVRDALRPVIQSFLQPHPTHGAHRHRHIRQLSSDLLHAPYSLFHPNNSIIDPSKASNEHNMSLPLSHYLVSSSHNTYLAGDQLQSKSSAEMYRVVLERGCRCVEIDVWNSNSEHGPQTPVVTHGHTMTTSQPLSDVLHVIADHAFSHGNDWPVVISLENHLDLEHQRIAAGLFRSIFKDMLFTADNYLAMVSHDLDFPNNSEASTSTAIKISALPHAALPSPSQLRRRIIVKAKCARSVYAPLDHAPPSPSSFSSANSSPSITPSSSSSSSFTATSSEAGSMDCFDSDDENAPKDTPLSASASFLANDDEAKEESKDGKKKRRKRKHKSKRKEKKIVEELDRLVLLAAGNRKALTRLWKNKESGEGVFLQTTCVSLDEKRMKDVHEKGYVDRVRDYNRYALTRVYPKGSRIGSSNYTPTMAHSMGCQFVALNWQRHDAALAVNEARFLSNGGCGYILSSSVQQDVFENRSPDRDIIGLQRGRGAAQQQQQLEEELIRQLERANLYSQPDPHPRHLQDQHYRCELKLNILCALLLPPVRLDDVSDPYVTVKLYDETFDDDDDYSCFKFETARTRTNSLVPVWRQETRLKIRNPHLAVINVKVYDSGTIRSASDELIGYCAVPVALLREGLRCLPLKSKKGDDMDVPGTDVKPGVLCDVEWLNNNFH